MRRTLCNIFMAMAVTVIPAICASAQPQPGQKTGFNGERRQMPSVDEMAKHKADAMDRELNLDDKQYKKIVKYYRTEIEKEREMMRPGRPEGMPEGFPGGGKPDFGGGRPPMGGPGGGFPGGPGMGGGRPPMGGPGMGASEEEMEKFFTQQDKKLKKILTPGQYDRWRAKHPAGQLPMLKPDFK